MKDGGGPCACRSVTRLPPRAREPMKAPCTAVGSRSPSLASASGSGRRLSGSVASPGLVPLSLAGFRVGRPPLGVGPPPGVNPRCVRADPVNTGQCAGRGDQLPPGAYPGACNRDPSYRKFSRSSQCNVSTILRSITTATRIVSKNVRTTTGKRTIIFQSEQTPARRKEPTHHRVDPYLSPPATGVRGIGEGAGGTGV